ncbi:phosphoglucosamine mutase [Nisaea nitritireducens]|uniref:phosphoglucosamine mutase n=1 Tax=Nisaea nitritireducens TaxID=568392 RepID=UPI001868116F|nr:phosphoglucosamine mutase [Nisaea nitritireducens]
MTDALFGTDGVRGKANAGNLRPDVVVRIAQAAGSLHPPSSGERHSVVIGKDTRLSCYMIENALAAGFASVGMDIVLTGPLPTPGVAMVTRSMRADLGVMISASHNPFDDNGIKLFGPDGRKVSSDVERRIADLVAAPEQITLADAGCVGRARRVEDAIGRYAEFVKASFPRELSLRGMRIVVDAANGAAYKVAESVLYELGADVIAINVSPNGRNINDTCGAVEPQALSEAVITYRADLGLALDGDADRVMLVDERGHIADGDQLLACIARRWSSADRLTGDGIAATVMSNFGLERWLGEQGLKLHRTQVGDRHVAECMWEKGLNLGGEQSGHVLCGDIATTGDGLIAGLQAIAAVIETCRPASEVLRLFEPVPQHLVAVQCRDRSVVQRDAVRSAVSEAERAIAGKGRVLVRPSGTEPVIRVMVEGEAPALVECLLATLTDVIASEDRVTSKAA